MTSVLWIVLAVVALQRLGELAYARRNTEQLRRRGGIEWGASHYPLLVVLHAAWLASMAVFIPASTAPVWPLLGVYAALQALRAWVIASLGGYWTTRIVTVPNATRVTSGPYRFFRHPNYAVVCAEIAILPLAFGALAIAVVFSLLNAGLLWWRVRIEERALATLARRPVQGDLLPPEKRDPWQNHI
jgi:methyltransferase